GLRRGGDPRSLAPPRRRRARLRGHRAAQGPRLDPRQDDGAGHRPRRGLRRDRVPRDPRRHAGAGLHGARDRPLDLAPGARPLQGLRRAAKPNGYQSLHTTVIGPYGERMEVQLRTREMHRAAEFGIAAHWKYKEGRADDADESKFAWLRQLVELNRDATDPHEFIDTVKVDLFPDQVFVFTPRGDVINLPKGASAVDFAYAIHSEVGAHCSGAKVNGRLVPLRHLLADGDTVEVITNPAQFPRKDWLEFVVSARARSRIRQALRAREKE